MENVMKNNTNNEKQKIIIKQNYAFSSIYKNNKHK